MTRTFVFEDEEDARACRDELLENAYDAEVRDGAEDGNGGHLKNVVDVCLDNGGMEEDPLPYVSGYADSYTTD